MKHLSKNILFCIICLVLSQTSILAQKMIKVKPGEAFILPELKTILILQKSIVKVAVVLPKADRSQEYKDVDIQENDEIIMVNGTKIKSPEDIEKMYQNLNVGEEMKLGIKRKGKFRIISFKKSDNESLPNMRMKKITIDDSDGVMKKTVTTFDSTGAKKDVHVQTIETEKKNK